MSGTQARMRAGRPTVQAVSLPGSRPRTRDRAAPATPQEPEAAVAVGPRSRPQALQAPSSSQGAEAAVVGVALSSVRTAAAVAPEVRTLVAPAARARAAVPARVAPAVSR